MVPLTPSGSLKYLLFDSGCFQPDVRFRVSGPAYPLSTLVQRRCSLLNPNQIAVDCKSVKFGLESLVFHLDFDIIINNHFNFIFSGCWQEVTMTSYVQFYDLKSEGYWKEEEQQIIIETSTLAAILTLSEYPHPDIYKGK